MPLEEYALRFKLPVRLGSRAYRVSSDDDGYLIDCGDVAIRTTDVVIATGAHPAPSIPRLAADLDSGMLQRHAHDYRNPGQLREGSVLVHGPIAKFRSSDPLAEEKEVTLRHRQLEAGVRLA